MRWADIENAKEKARSGDLDGAIETARVAVEFGYESGDMMTRGSAVTALTEFLVRRGGERDLAEAGTAIDRLAAVPVDPGFVLHELPLLTAARTAGPRPRRRSDLPRPSGSLPRHGESTLGFEGHIAIAEAMD